MFAFSVRAAVLLAGCTSLMACSQPAETPMVSSGNRASFCIAGGPSTERDSAPQNPWAITVSNEGAACRHTRTFGATGQRYDVIRHPVHGLLEQEPRGGATVLSYRPHPGFIGSDSFLLRTPGSRVDMPYLIAVIPARHRMAAAQ